MNIWLVGKFDTHSFPGQGRILIFGAYGTQRAADEHSRALYDRFYYHNLSNAVPWYRCYTGCRIEVRKLEVLAEFVPIGEER
jgi:hypothetical protein